MLPKVRKLHINVLAYSSLKIIELKDKKNFCNCFYTVVEFLNNKYLIIIYEYEYFVCKNQKVKESKTKNYIRLYNDLAIS